MTSLAYHYRRCYLDGDVGISISRGPMRVLRDDAEALVFDYLLAGPIFTEPAQGRRGSTTSIIARPAPTAARLWLLSERPMRIMQQFDAAGRPTLFRIDFATCPYRCADAMYQTDLYLDLFATADEHDYAILDEDELETAQRCGLITAALVTRVHAQADELVALLEVRQLGAWLSTWCDTSFEIAALTEQHDWIHHEYVHGEPDGWPQVIG